MVNESTTKTAPRGAINQLLHLLSRIIHALAEADKDVKVFIERWDIKDGFWRVDCKEGEEHNFAYVLPQEEGHLTKLVTPTTLKMGWIESSSYFRATSETGRVVAEQFVERPVRTLPGHKFVAHVAQEGGFQEHA